MKRLLALALILALLLSLGACAAKEEKVELTVFAAASLQETLTEIGNNYMAEHENVTLTFNFDSSGTLKTQIESDRKSTRLNSSHGEQSRMPSSA